MSHKSNKAILVSFSVSFRCERVKQLGIMTEIDPHFYHIAGEIYNFGMNEWMQRQSHLI